MGAFLFLKLQCSEISIYLSVYLFISLSIYKTVPSGRFWRHIVPCDKFWSPCLGMALQLQEQRYTHSYHCVQYFRVFKQWYGCQCLGFLNCTLMPVSGIFKLHTDVYACDCTQELYTVRESALEKQTNFATPGTRTHISCVLYPLSYYHPKDDAWDLIKMNKSTSFECITL